MSDLTDENSWGTKWAKKTNKRTWTIGEKAWSRFFHNQFNDLDQEACILELGCAPGNMIERMFTERNDLIIDGVDFSDIGIKKAQKIYKNKEINGSLYQQDIRIPLEKEYDIVCSYGLIEHFDNPKDIINSHIEKLKIGGKVIITVPNFVSKPAKWALPKFSPETLETHNLKVMNELYLNDTFASLGLENIQTGAFGGCLFPVGSLKPSFDSKIYKFISSLWNLSLSLLNTIINVEKISPWQSHIFITGVKK